ncbi:MAG TPA: DUF2180 family protein [Anaerolineae bacterium]|nr:DUF2180 family protein [Anaerolineae bacterium]
MLCWECDKPAQAVCAFCGRGVCKDHVTPHLTLMAMYLGEQQTPKSIVVNNAIWCGICEPIQEPIPMPEMY